MSALIAIQDIYWYQPWWLLLALQPIAIIIIQKFLLLKRHSVYTESHLQAWVITRGKQDSLLNRIFSKNSCYFLAWILIALAVAGPRLPQSIPGQTLKTGTDIMLVVDISRSMKARDIAPDRLRRSMIELTELVDQAKMNRLGMIVFAAQPHLFIPMTSDNSAFKYYLNSLDGIVLPTRGSQLTIALEYAYEQLQTDDHHSAILLITDGDYSHNTNTTNDRNRLDRITNKLKQANIPVYILGMGTIEGDAIPTRKAGWLKNNGKAVISKLNKQMLVQLADETKGRFTFVQDNDSDWHYLYQQGLARHFDLDLETEQEPDIIWLELYYLALFPGLLLLIYSLVPYRLSLNNKLFSILAILLLVQPVQSVKAAKSESRAYRDYLNEDFRASLDKYKNLSDYSGRFGEGASHYQLSDYMNAISHFSQAVLLARTDNERALALYNLGNSYFNLGDYHSAILTYQDVLVYKPEDSASQHNLSYSKELLKLVESRIQEEVRGNRAGSGPRQGEIDEGVILDENVRLSMGEQKESAKSSSATATPSKDSTAELIQRGIEFIKFAADSDNKTLPGYNFQTDYKLDQARQHLDNYFIQQEKLWIRLFEMEENFPAPLTEPVKVKGVDPW